MRILSEYVKRIAIYGFAVAFISASMTVKIEKNSEHSHVQTITNLGWFETNAVEKTPTITLYKRVSEDFKTQEGTKKETTWAVGSMVTHPAWNPTIQECGEGKFHACSRPYFCDEFRNNRGDRYVAISVKLEDLYEWTDNPEYPHKIAFRTCEVIYECDKHGRKVAG